MASLVRSCLFGNRKQLYFYEKVNTAATKWNRAVATYGFDFYSVSFCLNVEIYYLLIQPERCPIKNIYSENVVGVMISKINDQILLKILTLNYKL